MHDIPSSITTVSKKEKKGREKKREAKCIPRGSRGGGKIGSIGGGKHSWGKSDVHCKNETQP